MIMVDIYFPAVDEVYNFKVDETIKIMYLLQEIGEMMSKKYKSSLHTEAKQFLLCSLDSSRILASNTTLSANGVKNGSRLMMV